MNGMCYWTTATGIESFEKEAEKMGLISNDTSQPILRYDATFYDFGMGQLGFSADMSSFANKSDLNVLLGSPGIYTWTGSTILLKESVSGHRQIIIPNNNNMNKDLNYLGIVYNMYRY